MERPGSSAAYRLMPSRGFCRSNTRRMMCKVGGNRMRPIRPVRRPFARILNFANAYRITSRALQGSRRAVAHVEQRIYSGFASNADQARMHAFHAQGWEDRIGIVQEIEDERYRRIAHRIVAVERPDLLTDRQRQRWASWRRERFLTHKNCRGRQFLPHVKSWPSKPRAPARSNSTNLRNSSDFSTNWVPRAPAT